MFNKIMGNFSTGQYYELQRWIEEGALDGTLQTICDVRRSVEKVFGIGKIPNEQIINAIIKAGGTFTNRPDSETGDYCYVNIEKVNKIIGGQF